nr:unnamed protein product [Digitaria exilis]
MEKRTILNSAFTAAFEQGFAAMAMAAVWNRVRGLGSARHCRGGRRRGVSKKPTQHARPRCAATASMRALEDGRKSSEIAGEACIETNSTRWRLRSMPWRK